MRQIHSALLASVACAMAVPAIAADLPRPVPVQRAPLVAPAAAYNWSGFYIGAHGGGVWGQDDSTIVSAPGILATGTGLTVNPQGFLAGGQAGFNYQISSWVFGVEVDGSWTNANDTVSIPSLIPGVSARTLNEVNWFATATGRLGFAANNFLLYVKGGGAWMDVDYTASGVTGAGTVVLGPATISDTRTGWTVGAGIEVGFWDNWSAKVEYNYMDFGSERYTFTAPGATVTADVDSKVHVIKGGINYRFNMGGPVVARY